MLNQILSMILGLSAVGAVLVQEATPGDRTNDRFGGYWITTVQQDRPFQVVLHVVVGDEPSGTLTCITKGMIDQSFQMVFFEGDQLVASLNTASSTIQFDLALSDDGEQLTGTLTTVTGGVPEESSLVFQRTELPADLPGVRCYGGVLSVGVELQVSVCMAPRNDGWVSTIDIPLQGIDDVFMPVTEGDEGAFQFTLDAPVPVVLDLVRSADGDVLEGMFRQGPVEVPLKLAFDPDGAVSLSRPQMPTRPYPYPTRDVLVDHPAGHQLAGTISMPMGDPAPASGWPAVVLVTGSGPQDRDETLLGHKPFLVIADHLARNGIASLRYDDRGCGVSSGDFSTATSSDLATDAAVVTAFLQEQPGIDPDRVGIIGHSEGGLIAPMVAAGSIEGVSTRRPVAFCVLMAGPGVPGLDVIKLQSRLLMMASGMDEALVESIVECNDSVLELALQPDVTPESLREAAMVSATRQSELMVEAEMEAMDQEQIQAKVETAMGTLSSPWLLEFLIHDPRPVLRIVRCPVLAINGTLDLQVWHDQNLPEIEKAMKDAEGPLTVIRYDGLNHLFHPASTGGIEEYMTIETTIDEQVLIDITGWINGLYGPDSQSGPE